MSTLPPDADNLRGVVLAAKRQNQTFGDDKLWKSRTASGSLSIRIDLD